MKSRNALIDLVLALAIVLGLLVPIAHLALALHIEEANAQSRARQVQVCNTEGSHCFVTSGFAAGGPFARVFPGH